MPNLFESYRINERIATLISRIFVAIMMSCTAVTAVNLAQRLAPEWEGGYLPWLCFVISLVAIYSQQRLRRTADLDASPGVYRLGEIIVILVVIKLIIYIWTGFEHLRTDISLWQEDFLYNFFNAEYLYSIFVVFLVWVLSSMYGEDLVNLEGDVDILQTDSLDGMVSNRGAVQQRMAGRIFTVGVIMVFVMSLIRMDIGILWRTESASRQGVVHVLAYFVIGLALLSLTQLSTRRVIWAWERIPVSQGLVRRWAGYSLAFLLLIMAIAFILPTGYTLGFLPTMQYLLGGLLAVAYALVMLVITPIFYLLSWMVRLFGLKPTTDNTPLNMERLFTQMPQLAGKSPPPWWDILKSVLLWGILIGVVGYAVYIYIHQNRDLAAKLRRLPGMAWLVKAWRWLVVRTRMSVASVPKVVQAGLDRLRASTRRVKTTDHWRFVNLRKLDAQQRILFYYLALIRRADELGLPRKPWQTPNEYTHSLKPNLPEAENDLETMTGEFNEARYTQHSIGNEQVGSMKQAWEHVRGILMSRKKH
jgi:hypothetical protein